MPKIKIKRAPKGGKSIKGFSKRPIKGPKKPIPQARRESSSSLSSPADLSDEHGYSAVDDVSDSDDDDEEHVFAAEEEHIISHERHRHKDVFSGSPRPDFVSVFADQDDEAADADNDESDDEDISPSQQGMQSFSSDVEFDDAAEDSSDDSESWNGFSVEEEPTGQVETSPAADLGTPTQRHVRFTGVPDSDSESDETEDDHDDFFPDIFVAQQSLDPNFRREIERDDDDDDNSSVSLSFWDHTEAAEAGEPWEYDHDYRDLADLPLDDRHLSVSDRFNGKNGPLAEWDEVHVLNPIARRRDSELTLGGATEPIVPQDDEEEEEESDDGYDSDGDTTDDDQPILISRKDPISPQKGATADAPSSTGPGNDTKSGEVKPLASRLPLRSSNKPICVLNPHTRKMMIFTPRKKRDLQRIPTDYFSLSKMAADGTSTANSALNNDLSFDMMSFWQMAGQSNQLYFDNTMKPTDALWSLPLSVGNAPSEESFLDDGEEDPEEKNLDIDDFIIFDGNSEAGDQEGGNAIGGSEDGTDQSRRSSTATGAEHTLFTGASGHLLDHLTNTRSVGAFRINQMQRKHILNGEATEDSIDFSNSYTIGALRGLKHGSLSGANTPLTPERRHKKRPVKSSLGSSLKRKASGMADDPSLVHKKQRSISEVQTLSV